MHEIFFSSKTGDTRYQLRISKEEHPTHPFDMDSGVPGFPSPIGCNFYWWGNEEKMPEKCKADSGTYCRKALESWLLFNNIPYTSPFIRTFYEFGGVYTYEKGYVAESGYNVWSKRSVGAIIEFSTSIKNEKNGCLAVDSFSTKMFQYLNGLVKKAALVIKCQECGTINRTLNLKHNLYSFTDDECETILQELTDQYKKAMNRWKINVISNENHIGYLSNDGVGEKTNTLGPFTTHRELVQALYAEVMTKNGGYNIPLERWVDFLAEGK